MESQDVLVLAAELGIGLAGFASLSAALRARVTDDRNRFQRARVSTLVITSLGVSFMAFLPMVLSLALADDRLLWRLVSALCGTWHLLTLIEHLRSVADFRTQPDFSPGAAALAAIAFTTSIGLNAFNAFSAATSWPFLGALLCALLVAGSRFVQLVDSLWADDDG